MTEKPKRLAPKLETLRELFLKSGNLCAFPNCTALMMDADGVFIGQVCHIEAAEEGGERFNKDMTNEERRAAPNLMLMCYAHHQVTNDVKKYTVRKMQKMKREHERRFSSPDRAILERLHDWTAADTPQGVENLGRANQELGWNHHDEELAEAVAELNEYIELLRRIPIEVRRFVGAIAQRMVKMQDTFAVREEISGTCILIDDVKSAFRVGDGAIRHKIAQLDSYGLGDLDEIDSDLGPQHAIRVRNLRSGWPLWLDLVLFCEKTNTPIGTFTEDLDFSQLDD